MGPLRQKKELGDFSKSVRNDEWGGVPANIRCAAKWNMSIKLPYSVDVYIYCTGHQWVREVHGHENVLLVARPSLTSVMRIEALMSYYSVRQQYHLG